MKPAGENYVVLDLLKTGGFGEIYRSLYNKKGIKRLCVLKTIKKNLLENNEVKDNFMDEIRVTFPLNHPNIGQIFEYGEDDQNLYIAMEYIQGITIRDLQKKINKYKKQIELTHAVHLILETCKGLNYAHDFTNPLTGKKESIIHRDISPQNIMIDFDGTVKVIDFGIAKAHSNLHTTQKGKYKGKPAYMAPEYINGSHYDHRFDQFSLGVIFWELICDKKLFTGKNYIDVLKKINQCEVPLPRFHNEDIPHELQEVVLKMLNKNPRKRYNSLQKAEEDLFKILHSMDENYSVEKFKNYIAKNFKSEIIWEKAKIKSLIEKNTRI